MTFQGVVTNPYFKPEPSGRMLQIQSGSSMEEEEEVEQDTFSSNADFIMSITKFANAYEMELSELIQDLNKELERVSVSSDGGDGNLLLEQASVGGGDDTAVCLAYAGEVEEVVGSIFPSGQASSDEDCEVFVGADTCTVQRHGSNRSRVLEQSSHVFKEFDDYELRLQKAIHDISSLSEDLNSESLIATSLIHGDAVWDRVALEADELSFTVGDEVEILDMSDDVWWYGNVRDSLGWFPASFIRLRVCQDPESEDVNSPPSSIKSWGSSTESSEVLSLHEDCQRHPPQPIEDLEPTNSPSEDGSDTVLPLVSKTFSMSKGSHPSRRMTIRRKDSMSSISPRKLTPKEVRGKIVEEILNTETAYVQHLEDIVEGYLKRCQAYNTLFDEEQIEIIFSNVEELYRFQRDFLQELQARVNKDCLEQSEIGEIFVINQHEFKVYSQYCNNHPNAVNEMNLLEGKEQYALFFESCRLLRNLQDISLGGFLLTPVQKICKYPLQLSELLKYTNEDHPDYRHVVAAQVAMKNVAMLINEQKRRIENMGKIGCWQKTIDGWKGPDLLETSSEMIHSGELQKISKGHSQERFFFLFDHQLIYCRKDTIGGKLGFKGRLNLDICRIHDYPDGSVLHGSTPVKNSWMMNNTAKDNKSYIIYAKSPQVKEKWMQAFRKERQIVRDDVERGFGVSMKMKKAAVSLCASSSEFRARRRSVHRRHAAVSESYDTVLKQKVENIGKRMTSPAMILAQATSPFPITKKSNKSRKKKNNSIPLVSSGPSKTAN